MEGTIEENVYVKLPATDWQDYQEKCLRKIIFYQQHNGEIIEKNVYVKLSSSSNTMTGVLRKMCM